MILYTLNFASKLGLIIFCVENNDVIDKYAKEMWDNSDATTIDMLQNYVSWYFDFN